MKILQNIPLDKSVASATPEATKGANTVRDKEKFSLLEGQNRALSGLEVSKTESASISTPQSLLQEAAKKMSGLETVTAYGVSKTKK